MGAFENSRAYLEEAREESLKEFLELALEEFLKELRRGNLQMAARTGLSRGGCARHTSAGSGASPFIRDPRLVSSILGPCPEHRGIERCLEHFLRLHRVAYTRLAPSRKPPFDLQHHGIWRPKIFGSCFMG